MQRKWKIRTNATENGSKILPEVIKAINPETKKNPPVKQNRPAGKLICSDAALRYLYQPGEQEGAGAVQRTRYGVSVFISQHIVLQGLRVYYLMPPALQRGFVTKELLIVPTDTLTRMS